jgi:hypothetical protein
MGGAKVALFRSCPAPAPTDSRLKSTTFSAANTRTNRSLKEATTVKPYHYNTRRQLKAHIAAFLNAYNFAKRLKTLRGLTPYEAICKAWAHEPDRFKYDPNHLTSGLNTWGWTPSVYVERDHAWGNPTPAAPLSHGSKSSSASSAGMRL